MSPVFSPFGKLRMAMDVLLPRKKGDADEFPRRFRAQAVRTRGVGKNGAAHGGGHLLGRPRTLEPSGHHAAVPRDRARAQEPRPGPQEADAKARDWRGRICERAEIRPVRELRARDGCAGGRSGGEDFRRIRSDGMPGGSARKIRAGLARSSPGRGGGGRRRGLRHPAALMRRRGCWRKPCPASRES